MPSTSEANTSNPRDVTTRQARMPKLSKLLKVCTYQGTLQIRKHCGLAAALVNVPAFCEDTSAHPHTGLS